MNIALPHHHSKIAIVGSLVLTLCLYVGYALLSLRTLLTVLVLFFLVGVSLAATVFTTTLPSPPPPQPFIPSSITITTEQQMQVVEAWETLQNAQPRSALINSYLAKFLTNLPNQNSSFSASLISSSHYLAPTIPE